jgi:hypothetical protein
MIRRRRPTREIPFSFDSFLDVVANVVGIILRLILVTWVGARAYHGMQMAVAPPVPAIEEPVALPEPEEPLTPELERQRQALAESQAKLLIELRQFEKVRIEETTLRTDLAAVAARADHVANERAALTSNGADLDRSRQTVALSLTEIQARNLRLLEELEALKRAPSAKQTLRYRTPISHPLQSEEIYFECKNGRITLIDVGSMLEEVKRVARDKTELLRTTWEVRDLTAPVGAFRLRYTIEREREGLDGAGIQARPNEQATFQYGVSGWEVVPIVADRGETEAAALEKGSAFRRIADSLDPNQTAVTMWVYPDSFALYRHLRDFLHDRDVTVAGRPLPDGAPIASSRHGTVSRGQ